MEPVKLNAAREKAIDGHIIHRKKVRRRANDPILYRHNTIDKCWKIIDRFLDDPGIEDKDKIFVSLQIACKEYDHMSKMDLQKLKGAQDVSKNLFLIEALKKAEKFNKTIDKRHINTIAINAGRKIKDATDAGTIVSEEELGTIHYDDVSTSVYPKDVAKHEAIMKKYRGNY